MHAKRLTHVETRLLERANRQWGLLRHEDLGREGLGRGAIAARIATRRLNRVHHRVYAFGHTVLRDEGRWLAALWACDDTVLSHWDAAAYHGWRVVPPAGDDSVHLSTTGAKRSRPGITVHRVLALGRLDVFRAGLFTVTTIPRTLVDLADVMTWAEFRALADAQPRLNFPAIRAAHLRAGRRPGRGRVQRLIEADDAHTKSEFERRFLKFLDRHGIGRPDGLNVKVAGHKADCHYIDERLVVELDGRAFHRRRAQMRADRQRDADYQLAGQRILRLVWDDLHPDEDLATAARLREFLGA